MNNPNALAPLPWRLAYEGAASIEDATGRIIVECITPAVAEALVLAVNSAHEARATDAQTDAQTARRRLDVALQLMEG